VIGALGELAQRPVEQVNILDLAQLFSKLRMVDLFATMHSRKHSSAFLKIVLQCLLLLTVLGGIGVTGVHAQSARASDPDSELQVLQSTAESPVLLVLEERLQVVHLT